jgi:DNA-binding response OmpR family regulator
VPRIAIVDDDALFADLLHEVFTELGWDLVRWHSPSEVPDRLEDQHIDALILDIYLPTPEEGWHLLSRIRADTTASGIPLIICSAAVREVREREEWLSSQGITVIQKPFDLDALLQTVEAAIGDRGGASSAAQ